MAISCKGEHKRESIGVRVGNIGVAGNLVGVELERGSGTGDAVEVKNGVAVAGGGVAVCSIATARVAVGRGVGVPFPKEGPWHPASQTRQTKIARVFILLFLKPPGQTKNGLQATSLFRPRSVYFFWKAYFSGVCVT
jgi:hypothetical protein